MFLRLLFYLSSYIYSMNHVCILSKFTIIGPIYCNNLRFFCKTERRMRAELITGIKWYLFSNSGLGVSPASRPPWSSMENTLNVYIHPRHRDALIQQIRSIPSLIPSNLLPFLDNFIPVIQSLHSTGKINFKSKIGENYYN